MSLRLSNIEIMCNAIWTMTSWWVEFLADEEEIDEKVMKTVGKNKIAINTVAHQSGWK